MISDHQRGRNRSKQQMPLRERSKSSEISSSSFRGRNQQQMHENHQSKRVPQRGRTTSVSLAREIETTANTISNSRSMHFKDPDQYVASKKQNMQMNGGRQSHECLGSHPKQQQHVQQPQQNKQYQAEQSWQQNKYNTLPRRKDKPNPHQGQQQSINSSSMQNQSRQVIHPQAQHFQQSTKQSQQHTQRSPGNYQHAIQQPTHHLQKLVQHNQHNTQRSSLPSQQHAISKNQQQHTQSTYKHGQQQNHHGSQQSQQQAPHAIKQQHTHSNSKIRHPTHMNSQQFQQQQMQQRAKQSQHQQSQHQKSQHQQSQPQQSQSQQSQSQQSQQSQSQQSQSQQSQSQQSQSQQSQHQQSQHQQMQQAPKGSQQHAQNSSKQSRLVTQHTSQQTMQPMQHVSQHYQNQHITHNTKQTMQPQQQMLKNSESKMTNGDMVANHHNNAGTNQYVNVVMKNNEDSTGHNTSMASGSVASSSNNQVTETGRDGETVTIQQLKNWVKSHDGDQVSDNVRVITKGGVISLVMGEDKEKSNKQASIRRATSNVSCNPKVGGEQYQFKRSQSVNHSSTKSEEIRKEYMQNMHGRRNQYLSPQHANSYGTQVDHNHLGNNGNMYTSRSEGSKHSLVSYGSNHSLRSQGSSYDFKNPSQVSATTDPKETVFYSMTTRYFKPEENDWVQTISRSGRADVPVEDDHKRNCIFWNELHEPDNEDIIIQKLMPPSPFVNRAEHNNALQFAEQMVC